MLNHTRDDVMAKTAAEYQRAYRQRKKANVEQHRDHSMEFLRGSLADYRLGIAFGFEESLDAFGVTLPTSSWLEPVQHFHSDGEGERTMSAIDRLEGLAGGFHDAAIELATFINAYKVSEAQRLRAELVEARYETLAEQKTAIAKIAEIDEVIRSLSRRHRIFLPVTGTNVA